MSKLSTLFNNFSKRLGNALQNTETAQATPTEDKQEQRTEVVDSQQQTRVAQPQGTEPAVEKTTETPKVEKVAPTVEPPKEEPQELESKENLLRSVISTLTQKIEYAADTQGKKLVIWLDCNEELVFNNYNSDLYRQQMLSYLINEKGFGFEQVEFIMGQPAAELKASSIGKNKLEYLKVIENKEVKKTLSAKAEICIFGDAGSLKQDKYILSSEEMKKKMITAYNIGAGQFPRVPTGYRENHIAIDDNPASPMVEKNKFVSRMHAHIGFSDKFGFYLQVEKDGTRLMGKRTRIFRGEEKIECDNPQAKIPLQDGDLIELGKAVVLRYIQLNEE